MMKCMIGCCNPKESNDSECPKRYFLFLLNKIRKSWPLFIRGTRNKSILMRLPPNITITMVMGLKKDFPTTITNPKKAKMLKSQRTKCTKKLRRKN